MSGHGLKKGEGSQANRNAHADWVRTQASRIIVLHRTYGVLMKDLALRFKVSPQVIKRILRSAKNQ